LPELQHRKNCLLADNLIQFAQEIITLINDPEQRQRLAKAGREAFEQQFTWEAMQPRFNQFLHKLKS
jgi:glycosyltransferase involved in cell wall biosynthesis